MLLILSLLLISLSHITDLSDAVTCIDNVCVCRKSAGFTGNAIRNDNFYLRRQELALTLNHVWL